ncbi:Down syndrome cell adhesion molecule-like protein 1 [Chamberlinius hualienensis]
MKRKMSSHALHIVVICCFVLNFVASSEELRLAPNFVQEPPDSVEFTNETGIAIHCVVNGYPKPSVYWMRNGLRINSFADTFSHLYQNYDNGTLLFYPFKAEEFTPDVLRAKYKCVASNSIGTIVSRSVHVTAVVVQPYVIQVHDVTVLHGNSAIFQCHVPLSVKDFVSVTLWLRDEELVIEKSNPTEDTKHLILPTGELFIKDVLQNENGSTFKCQTVHSLTGETRTSNTSGRLVVTSAEGVGVAPKIVFSKAEVVANELEDMVIPCVADGNPPPEVKWHARLQDGLLLPIHFGGRMEQLGSGLLIKRAQVSDSGAYVCDVKNGYGNARGETSAVIQDSILVSIQPSNQTVEIGSTAVFRCVVSGNPIHSIKWLKDGQYLPVNTASKDEITLTLPSVKWSDIGIYQCIAENSHQSAQSMAQLLLGDIAPELQEVFTEQAFSPLDNVTLACSAIGSPSPVIQWFLDDVHLNVVDEDEERYSVDEYITAEGATFSTLYINSVRIEDGGVYRCVATNNVGRVEHSARVNVYGPISVRSMSPVTAVTGQLVIIHCPVYGYPIDSIQWWKDGDQLPQDLRQSVYPNGTLMVSDVSRTMDAGRYTCVASNKQGDRQQQHVDINILMAPKILPFSFQGGHLFEGVLARVSCVVYQGDFPLKLSWTKDGRPISSDVGISITEFDEYSSILTISDVTPAHSGNYTCTAQNHAATAIQTAELIVNVPPRWKLKPEDLTVVVGEDAILHCVAEGFPQPTISWMWSNEVSPGARKKLIRSDSVYDLLSNGSLVIERTTRKQQGHYFCQAGNNVGPSISAVSFLAVKFPAKLSVWQSNLTIHHGNQFNLECKASGDFPMNFTWIKDGQVINTVENDRYIIREIMTNGGVTSELTVTSAMAHDSTKFGCNVENAYGKDAGVYVVTVQQRPEAPEIISIDDLSSRYANISWTPPFNGHSPILGYFIEYKKTMTNDVSSDSSVSDDVWLVEDINGKSTVETDDNQIMLIDLQPATFYYVRLFAKNEVGISHPSPTIVINTDEEAPTASPRMLRAWPVNSKTLTVCWQPPLNDTLNGLLKGYWLGHKVWGSADSHNFKQVISGGLTETCANVTGLRKFVRYSVVVKAYNEMGRGPDSKELMAMTAEGTPSESATNVTCSALSPTSVLLLWQPAPLEKLNGILKEYKVLIYKGSGILDGNNSDVRNTTGQEIIIDNLDIFSDYSFRITGVTVAGDGTPTDPIVCRTKEDVPGVPAAVRAVIVSTNTVLVTWKPPIKTNGMLIQYNVHMKEEWSKPKTSINWSVPAELRQYEVPNLKENQKYSFWVTASTSAGDGEATKVVTLIPKGPQIPAQMISFDDTIEGIWRQTVIMPCTMVGFPIPERKWYYGDGPVKVSPTVKILGDGTLLIKEAQGHHSGNYTCSVKNSLAKDRVRYTVKIKAPPDSPQVSSNFTSRNSIGLNWIPGSEYGSPIKGYIMMFRREGGKWEQIDLDSDVLFYEITDLQCGANYEITLTALNDIGKGKASDVFKVTTNGSVAELSKEIQGIEEGETSLTVHLEKLVKAKCPIEWYAVEYKKKFSEKWINKEDMKSSVAKTIQLNELMPATWYKIRITAKTTAGLASEEYEMATSGILGGTATPDSQTPVVEDGRSILFYIDLRIVIPIAACIGLLLLALVIMCVCVEKKKDVTQPSPRKIQKSENSNNSHLARRPKNSDSTNDSFTNLRQSNLESKFQKNYSSAAQQDDNTTYSADNHFVGFNIRPSNEDLAPYATYHLNNATELQTFQQRTTGVNDQTPLSDIEGSNTLERVKMQVLQQLQQSRPKSYTPGYANVLAESPSTAKKKLRQVAIPTAPNVPPSPSRHTPNSHLGSQTSVVGTPYQMEGMGIAAYGIKVLPTGSRPGTPVSYSNCPSPIIRPKPLLISNEVRDQNTNFTNEMLRPSEINSLPLPPRASADFSPVYSNVADAEFLTRQETSVV